MVISRLEVKAKAIRKDIITMLLAAGSGHSAGPLGMTDVFTAIYFGGVVNVNPKKSSDPNRDRVFLSNGHICPVWYATLANAGYFPRSWLKKLRQLDSPLQGHPHRGSAPGIENTGGPLAQGLSQAVGAAVAAKMDKKKWQVYCLCGDGELNEGQIWEAVMFAGKHRLDNLTVIVDRNNIQIDGMTEDVMPLEPLADKFTAFNWHVLEINGHNMAEILNALETARAIYEKPVVIIAHTIPGKGVDFMEFDYEWHGKPPNQEQARGALEQLRTLRGKIQYD